MVFNIAIVDDEEVYAKTLESYIERFGQESGSGFNVRCFSDGDELPDSFARHFDVIFLDIIMKRMDGMSVARFIRKLDQEVVLVFVTNSPHYAIEGYSVGATDYLLKPVTYFAFSELLRKTVSRISKKRGDFLLLACDAGTVRIETSDIIYIESFRNKMIVHTAGKEYSMYSTMSELESKLAGKGFFRCNKSFLINLKYVKSISGSSVIVDDREISIGRAKKQPLMDALMSCFSS